MACIYRKPKNGREDIVTKEEEELINKPVQELLSRYDSLSDQNVPCVSPYPKTRHPRGSIWNLDTYVHKACREPFKNPPFPYGKLRDELAKYEDGDLARLVGNCSRAYWMLGRMISQPLSETLLYYYVYVQNPFQLQFQKLYKGQDVKKYPSDIPMEWQGKFKKRSDIDQYRCESLVEIILTDLSYRNNYLANQLEQLCKKILMDASKADDYFGRLTKYTPSWWNERNYKASINKFRACLKQLLEKLNHIGQLYENELKSTGQAKTEKKNKSTNAKTKRNRPTKADMANRNKAVAMAAAQFKADHGRLPTVDDIKAETEYTRNEIYATNAYKEGKVAKSSAKAATEMTGGSVHESQQFSETSELHSRADKRSKAEQDELDVLVDKQKEDNSSDFVKK